jgi:hypothetical protein
MIRGPPLAPATATSLPLALQPTNNLKHSRQCRLITNEPQTCIVHCTAPQLFVGTLHALDLASHLASVCSVALTIRGPLLAPATATSLPLAVWLTDNWRHGTQCTASASVLLQIIAARNYCRRPEIIFENIPISPDTGVTFFVQFLSITGTRHCFVKYHCRGQFHNHVQPFAARMYTSHVINC